MSWDLSNCACCTIDCPSSVARIKRRLHAKVTICGVDTPLPDAVYDSGSNNWIWAATAQPNRVPIVGGGSTSWSDGFDLIDAVGFPCTGVPGNWGTAGIQYFASNGLDNVTGSISGTVLSSSPFRIRYYFGETGGLGLTFCSGSVFAEFWE